MNSSALRHGRSRADQSTKAPRDGSATVAASASPSARATARVDAGGRRRPTSAASAAASVGSRHPAPGRGSSRAGLHGGPSVRSGAPGGRARTSPRGTGRGRSAPGRRRGWRRRGSCPSSRRAARAGRRAPSARSCSRRSAGCRPTRAAAAGSRRPPRGGSRWRWPPRSTRRRCRARGAQPGQRLVDGAGDPGDPRGTTGGALPSAQHRVDAGERGAGCPASVGAAGSTESGASGPCDVRAASPSSPTPTIRPPGRPHCVGKPVRSSSPLALRGVLRLHAVEVLLRLLDLVLEHADRLRHRVERLDLELVDRVHRRVDVGERRLQLLDRRSSTTRPAPGSPRSCP